MDFEFKNVVWGVSRRRHGQMKFGDDDANKVAWENRKAFFETLGIDGADTMGARLVHGDHIEVVTSKDKGKIFTDADGFATNEKNLFLTITIADCAPIFLYDQKCKTIGLIHTGWRGTIKNIIGKAVQVMHKTYGSRPQDIAAHIGPHIRSCHFEIKDDVLAFFEKYSGFVIRESDKIVVDLSGILKRQLQETGMPEENISVSDACTFCDAENFYSYRRDRPAPLQAMVAFIGMK